LSKHKYLIALFSLATALRLVNLTSWTPFFGDQGWFYMSAKNALLTGIFPALGITASITWLHQGPLYTYLIIPGLALSNFHPISGIIFNVILSSVSIPLLYYLCLSLFSRKVAVISALIYAFSPLAIVYSRIAYHTTLIPAFLIIFSLLFYKNKYLLSGLFLGFLYQLHLLTFIFWPFVAIIFYRRRYFSIKFILGFILGIIPFLLAGLIPTFGIFAWLITRLSSGGIQTAGAGAYFGLLAQTLFAPLSQLFSRFGTGSEAYFTVFLIPLIVAFSVIISVTLKNRMIIKTLLGIIIIGNLFFLFKTRYLNSDGHYGLTLGEKITLATDISEKSLTSYPQLAFIGPGSEFDSSLDPYRYLVWWRKTQMNYSGTNHWFLINENKRTVTVLK